MRFLVALCLLASVLAIVNADYGIDVDSPTSQGITSSQWSCLAGKNQRAIIQAWQGGYGLNSGIVGAIQGAQAAGFSIVDIVSSCD
ncbi:hypothetical protein SAMD00019534_119560 [Acytostelium subglobosum LB1]|uniref:hypothetical protein n=1 Tax=Acytostelium subglobosum LB1 TaxID=1410327 RepID=UPI000644E0E9|nr:hypothetical protein SAMD00019534_119560 [Acytostelium subglobosum LB1]GAM28780.1 hypothetical protein SAMD00019534_119560 [Acytostelium subglobosum LB1]|eukprot:XP_012748335.1 hypothetical protein SAMD00019534_119560 [Acytostelium subglobosum LB1]